MDLVIRGGTVVTSGSVALTDVGIADGKVRQIGGEMSAATEIDATGKYVLPGGVDMHVHLTAPGTEPGSWSWVDDFDSGSRAALAGGVTTVGNISFPRRGETMADGLARDIADAEANSLVDVAMHPVLMNPDEANLDQIPELIAAGHSSIKIFMSFRRFDRQVADYLEGMRRIAKAGGIALMHCEDVGVMDCCCAVLNEEGRTAPKYYPEARPETAEWIATARAVAYAEITKCPTYVVHLAAQRALDAVRDGRRRGTEIYVETRPLYLHLTSERFEEDDGAKYAGAPPLREPADRDAMWNGMVMGDIATVCTDHAPWMLADKLDPDQHAADLKQGVADLETMCPMIWSEGVRTGRISLTRFVETTSTNAAKLFGMYPQKGTIAVGSDADIVVWDPDETRIVDGPTMHSNADFTVYDGWEVTGWPAYTIAAGRIAAEGTKILAEPGHAKVLKRGPHQPL